MDHARLQQPQGKSSMARHRERNEDSSDKRSSESPKKHVNQDEERPFRRLRSPSRPCASGSFKPKFGGRVFRPRFLRDERAFRKPVFGFGLQRFHHHFGTRPHFNWRDQSPGPRIQHNKLSEREPRDMDRGNGKERSDRSPTVTHKEHNPSTPRSMSSSSREREKNPLSVLSFTVSQEGKKAQSREREGGGGDRELPPSVNRAAARNRAIQQKRTEIEEVYRQDCDTLGLVVRMLISKEPSLELPIQSALRENLREIGLRCVEAMQKFIDEYNSREHSP